MALSRNTSWYLGGVFPFFLILVLGPMRDREKELDRLARLLTSASPKLSEFYALCGAGLGEEEGRLFVAACTRRGLSEKECLERNLQRWMQRDTTESLYVLWLQAKLPSRLVWQIQKVERRGTGPHELKTELIWAILDEGTTITFMRVLDKSAQGHFGIVSVAMINEVSVDDLLEGDLARGLTPDIK